MWLLLSVYAVFGLIAGSFLNVLILRHAVCGLGGRSTCPHCVSVIAWYDNVPFFSWFFLRGRCRTCRSSISIQYPLVEAATALLFVALGGAVAPSFESLTQPLTAFLLTDYFVLAALFVAIFVYDMYHTIIPNAWVYTAAVLALCSSFLAIPSGAGNVLFILLAGPIAAFPLFALWAISHGRWMGFGDVKLSLSIGWLLGSAYGLLAILLAFVIGAVVSLCVLLPLPYLIRALGAVGITRLTHAEQGYTMKSEIPFGPFLIISCITLWLILAYGNDLSLSLLAVSL